MVLMRRGETCLLIHYRTHTPLFLLPLWVIRMTIPKATDCSSVVWSFGEKESFFSNSQLPTKLQTLAFQLDTIKKQMAESLHAGPCQLPPLLTSFAGGGTMSFLGRGFRASRESQVERVHCVDATLWPSWVDLEWTFPLLSQNPEQGERNHAWFLVASIPKVI